MAVVVDNSKVIEFNKPAEAIFNVATIDTVNGTEVFTVDMDVADQKTVLLFSNEDALAYTVTLPANRLVSDDLVLTIPEGNVIAQIEAGKYKEDNGTLKMTFKPGTGKKLLADHSATVVVLGTK